MPTDRLLCSELVSIIPGGSRGPLRAVPGNLEEIGEWSALVLTEAFLGPGMRLSIACEWHEIKGVVESCTFEPSLGYYVEVKLDPESRWSQQWFTPQHLVALWDNLGPKVLHLKTA